MPLSVGAPLIVIILEAQAAVTPFGRPVALPILVAPVVVCVIFKIAVFTHTVGLDEATPAVFEGITTIVPTALTLPQPPINGIV